MMDTVNISLTKDQSNFVDRLISQHGFANRSEFFRSLLRLVHAKPQIIDQADSLILEPPNTKSRKEILKSFSVTKRYSRHFLSDLEKGLKKSSYFND